MITAVKFLYQYQTSRHFPVEIVSIPGSNDSGGSVIIFSPCIGNNAESQKTDVILVVHGMTMYGNRDPRYISLCKSLAGCGFRVFLPNYKSIRELKFDPCCLDEIKRSIYSITENRNTCPRGKLSIFTNSFSGGPCLLACSDSIIGDRISSLCIMGGYGDIDTSLDYLMGNQDSDPYGRFIVLKNFLRYSIEVPASIEKAIDVFLDDHFYEREGKKPELGRVLEAMSPNELDLFQSLLTNSEERMRHWAIIKNNDEIRKLLRDYSLGGRLDAIQSSVLLLHGADDAVIPPEESVRLYCELRKSGVRAQLLVTPLIMAHSNLKFNMQFFKHVLDLFRGLDFYFKSA